MVPWVGAKQTSMFFYCFECCDMILDLGPRHGVTGETTRELFSRQERPAVHLSGEG